MSKHDESLINVSFVSGGKRYVLVQDAYIDGVTGEEHYTALAISPDDTLEKNEYGHKVLPCYEVNWEILETTRKYWENGGDDESCACDWNNPCSVNKTGAWDLDDKTFF